MKTLILIRHASAEPAGPGGDDFHRALSPAGEKEAVRMASRTRMKGETPDLIVSSPADRALETALAFARRWGYPVRKIVLDESIFKGPSLLRLQEVVHGFEDRVERAVIVGHNPSLSDLARLLLGRRSLSLPKASVLRIAFDVPAWKDCGPRTAALRSFVVPGAASRSREWLKPIRRELAARLTEASSDILARLDPDAAGGFRKTLKTFMKKIAEQFLGTAGAIRLSDREWLARMDAAQPHPAPPPAGKPSKPVHAQDHQ